MQLKIIEDWRGVHKRLSTVVAAALCALLGFIAENPSFAGTVWMMIPAELRPDVPAWGKWAIASFTAFAVYLAATLLKQPLLKKPKGDA